MNYPDPIALKCRHCRALFQRPPYLHPEQPAVHCGSLACTAAQRELEQRRHERRQRASQQEIAFGERCGEASERRDRHRARGAEVIVSGLLS